MRNPWLAIDTTTEPAQRARELRAAWERFVGGDHRVRVRTPIADSWEREGDDPQFFFHFSPNGYAVGLNAVLYAMTH